MKNIYLENHEEICRIIVQPDKDGQGPHGLLATDKQLDIFERIHGMHPDSAARARYTAYFMQNSCGGMQRKQGNGKDG